MENVLKQLNLVVSMSNSEVLWWESQGAENETSRLAQRHGADRIMDYDVNNDNSIVDPRNDPEGEYLRPVLGGPQMPYPRRLRTGRPIIDGREAPPRRGVPLCCRCDCAPVGFRKRIEKHTRSLSWMWAAFRALFPDF